MKDLVERLYNGFMFDGKPCCRYGKKFIFKASVVDEWIITSLSQPVKRRMK